MINNDILYSFLSDIEANHGYWQSVREFCKNDVFKRREIPTSGYFCSDCGGYITTTKTRYCPHCGLYKENYND